MDTKKHHRRQRLIELLDMTYRGAWGHRARASKLIGCEPSYLSRILGDPNKGGYRYIGEELQQTIEIAFNLADGWLDMPIGTPLISRGIESTSQNCVIECSDGSPTWPFLEISKDQWLQLDSTQKTKIEIGIKFLMGCFVGEKLNAHDQPSVRTDKSQRMAY